MREPYLSVHQWLQTQKIDDLKRKRGEAEAMFRRTGITFAVYGDEAATERLIPFDIIPRILSAAEWRRLAAGIEQRVRALNAFMYDIYHRQEIIRAGRVPEELIIQNSAFVPEMMGVEPPRGIYSHIIGIDIVRTRENEFFVLEDNTRTPSGVSYMLENRETMMHMFPELFARNRVAAVEDYPENLRLTLESVAPDRARSRADRRGADARHLQQRLLRALVPRRPDGRRAGRGPGPRRHRRRPADEDHAGPEAGRCRLPAHRRRLPRPARLPAGFGARACPGCSMSTAPAALTIVNAPGAGIADDKAIYTYMPEIIEFYTGRAPILKNVPTYNCRKPDDSKYVLEHLPELVVKQVHGSGGYGMLVGPAATKDEIEMFRQARQGAPRPLHRPADAGAVDLPDAGRSRASPRHLDLRPSCWSATGCGSRPAGSRALRCARARWWSIRARAAARRTHGFQEAMRLRRCGSVTSTGGR